MYESHFGFEHKPFAITPDPRYLYLSARHREALAHLLYGVGEGGGFVLLTGEVGTGKTTLCRSLLGQLPEQVDVALILNPRLDAVELVAAICDELGAPWPEGSNSLKALVDALNTHLLRVHAAGRRTVVVIDEAQNLAPDVLEQIRLLTNLETAETKLLEIILIGQPELREILDRRELRQLAQRITARYHLDPLTRVETTAYIRHRLHVAGVTRPLFTGSALDAVYRLSGGVPRLINILCDRALLGAWVEGRGEVDGRILRRAAHETRVTQNAAGAWWAMLPGRKVLRPLLAILLLVAAIPVATHIHRSLPASAPMAAAVTPSAVTVAPPSADLPVPSQTEVMDSAGSQKLLGDDESAVFDLLLAAFGRDAAGDAAWDGLFRLWGERRDGRQPPCEEAEKAGLRCLSDGGNWTLIQRLDRPVLLVLNDDGGRSGLVLLAALDGREAVVEADGVELRVPIAAIDRYWYGDYFLLWRPPLDIELLREGDRGFEVLQLRSVLDQLLPPAHPANGDDALFDAGLTRRVKEFQSLHGLQDDGIVGTQTMIRLSTMLNETDSPSLRPGR